MTAWARELALLLIILTWQLQPSILLQSSSSSSRQPPLSPNLASTQHGLYNGLLLSPSLTCRRHGGLNSQVDAYYGVQYASVQGSKLRFMPPTSTIEKWKGVRLAIKFRPVCPQVKYSDELKSVEVSEDVLRMLKDQEYDVDGDKQRHASRNSTAEDGSAGLTLSERRRKLLQGHVEKQSEECLFLNIYTPHLTTDRNSTSLFPVVVFVHGDSFHDGTGNVYDGSLLSGFGHVVVVTLNYRLGVLGFLSSEDASAQGNYALLDITAALYWVRNNIKGFHGNRDSVTLVGARYGAALVNILMVSTIARGQGLFHRCILLGGSALCSDCIINNGDQRRSPLRDFQLLAAILNCYPISTAKDESSERLKDSNKTQRLKEEDDDHDDDERDGDGEIVRGERTRKHAKHIDSVLQCLRQVPVAKVLAAARFMSRLESRHIFGPTIDRRKASILPDDVAALARTPAGWKPPRDWKEKSSPRHERNARREFVLDEGAPLADVQPGRRGRHKNKRDISLNDNHPSRQNTAPARSPPNDKNTTTSPTWFSSLPLLVGVDAWEGLGSVREEEAESGLSQRQLDQLIKTFVDKRFSNQHDYLYDLITHQYTDWTSTTANTRRDNLRTFVDVINDSGVTSPLVEISRLHSTMGGKSYLFSSEWEEPLPSETSDVVEVLFETPWSSAATPPVKNGAATTPDNTVKQRQNLPSPHLSRTSDADDDSTPAAAAATDATATTKEMNHNRGNLSECTDDVFTLFCYLVNFIRAGNPNSNSSDSPCNDLPYWPAYINRQEKYMNFASSGFRPTVKHHLRGEKVALWLNLISKIQQSTTRLELFPRRKIHFIFDDKFRNGKLFQDDQIGQDGSSATNRTSSKQILPFDSHDHWSPDISSHIKTNHSDKYLEFVRNFPGFTRDDADDLNSQIIESQSNENFVPKHFDPWHREFRKFQRGYFNTTTTTTTTASDAHDGRSTSPATTSWIAVFVVVIATLNISILACLCLQKWRQRLERKRKRRYKPEEGFKFDGSVLTCSTQPLNEDNNDDRNESPDYKEPLKLRPKQPAPPTRDCSSPAHLLARSSNVHVSKMVTFQEVEQNHLDGGSVKSFQLPLSDENGTAKNVRGILTTFERRRTNNDSTKQAHFADGGEDKSSIHPPVLTCPFNEHLSLETTRVISPYNDVGCNFFTASAATPSKSINRPLESQSSHLYATTTTTMTKKSSNNKTADASCVFITSKDLLNSSTVV